MRFLKSVVNTICNKCEKILIYLSYFNIDSYVFVGGYFLFYMLLK